MSTNDLTPGPVAATPVEPPSLRFLESRVRALGYEAPVVSIGDVEGVPAVHVLLRDSPMRVDVEAICPVNPIYNREGRAHALTVAEAEYICTRSALAEALVLALSPEARRPVAEQ
jgi:hypothetical protein